MVAGGPQDRFENHCLRPSMCSYDGELFNLDFSVHVLFPSYRDSDLYLPLYD